MGHQFITDGMTRLLFDHTSSGISPKQVNELIATNKFTTLAESINDTVFTLDVDQRYTGIYGVSLRENHETADMYLGKTPVEILGIEAAKIHTEANQKALMGQFLTYDWNVDDTEQTKWYQTSLAPLATDAEVYGVVGVTRNVSELRRAVDNYVRLFNASPLPQWIYRLSDLKFVAVNNAAVEHYGYSADEFMSMTITDIRPAEEVPQLKDIIETSEQLGKSIQRGNHTHIRKDGTKIHVQMSGHKLEFSGDECAIVVANDVTLNEEALSELELRDRDIQSVIRKLKEHRLALDKTANIMITDADGIIIEVNDNTCDLSGYSRDELVGQHSRMSNSGKHSKEFFKDLWDTVKRGDIWRDEIYNRRKDGTFYWVDTTIVPLLGPEGSPIQYMAVRFNISDRKDQDEKLLVLNKELAAKAKALSVSNTQLEQFAFVVSHDLQEPIRMIMSFLALLKKRYEKELDDKALSYIDYAVTGAKQMRQIIIDLLEYSQVDERFKNKADVDLNKVVSTVLLLFKRTIADLDAQITVGKLPVINTYEYPLESVFINLIDNALRYKHENRNLEISITADDGGDVWTIRVRDNGIGIEAEYFDKIFVIFQRLHAKTAYSGTGIGLAITKKMVGGLGGEISVTSEEGEWTEFAFTLPKVVV
jgi:PAS domain S-box-containing protein